MSIEHRPDGVVIVRLANDPAFADDLAALATLEDAGLPAVLLSFAGVRYLNSSNLAKLLRLRRRLLDADRPLVLCEMNAQVKSVFHVTGLDRIFVTADDLARAETLLRV